LPLLREEFSALEVPAAAGGLQGGGLSEAAAERIPAAKTESRRRIPPGVPGQLAEMAQPEPRVLEEVPRKTPRFSHPKPRRQKARDRKQRLLDLANNTSALDLKHSAAGVWLLNAAAADLANNTSVSGQVFVIEALPRRKSPGSESCKQQPAGALSAVAG
jgi:hypothetical protein